MNAVSTARKYSCSVYLGCFLAAARALASPHGVPGQRSFPQDLGQGIRGLLIEDRNVGAAGHGFIACPKGEDTISLLTSGVKVGVGEHV